jgi:4a-hydroxytetrahydrobiopterin dehydratase
MWENKENKLVRQFVFKDFVEAFAFMTKVALLAEKMDHHPTFINTYNKVEVILTTHDAGNTVSEKDFKLANLIDGIL